MKLPTIDRAIEACRDHLNSSHAAGTEVEAYLTSYLLILMCANFEEKIEELVVARAERSEDPALHTFVQSAVGAVFRSTRTAEIAGLLNRFGTQYKIAFQAKMQQNPKAETFFNNIVVNRHEAAHKGGSPLTLSDLVQFYELGHMVLDAVQEAISL